jgi:hypothetical protein
MVEVEEMHEPGKKRMAMAFPFGAKGPRRPIVVGIAGCDDTENGH